MSDWRCPHGRIHINGGDGRDYYKNLNQYGKDTAYQVFIDGTVHCAVCTELNTQKLMAVVELKEKLRLALS